MQLIMNAGFIGALLWLTNPVAVLAGGTVTTPDEASLRAALAGGGTVVFACDGTIALANTLEIANNTVIDASGHSVILSGNNTVRVFAVSTSITLALINLTVADGQVVGASGAPGSAGGDALGAGAWVKQGTLVASNCRFLNNHVVGGLGGTTTATGQAGGMGGQGCGGGVDLSSGRLLATNCVFAGNSAGGGTGGQGAGPGGNSLGGAIRATNSAVVMVGCQFFTNQARGGVIGSYGDVGSSIGGSALGGAVCLQGGSLTNLNCQFAQNSAWATNRPFGFTYLNGSPCRGGALYYDAGLVALTGCAFVSNNVTGGHATRYHSFPGAGQGGAIYGSGSMEASASAFSFNSAVGGNQGDAAGSGEGGAIYNGGTSSVRDSSFSGNRAQGGVGIISSRAYPNGPGLGGAIRNTSVFRVSGCTLSDNSALGLEAPSATAPASAPSSGFGGAIHNSGSLYITNSTLARNLAIGGSHSASYPYGGGGADAFGGAIFNSGSVIAVNDTLASNNAIAGTGVTNGIPYGGGIYTTNGAPASLRSAIVAHSSSGGNAFGTLTDLGHNLSSDASCSFAGSGSLNNTDPVLAPLDNYGGPTPTMALLSGSPAINGGDPVSYPPTDQRGHGRPFGPAPDMGAFESSPPYSVRGTVSGATLEEEILVVSDLSAVQTTNVGRYEFDGLSAGSYTVTPQSASYLFVPANRSVAVGPDQVGVDFKAYQWNALSLDDVNGGVMHVVFAGTNGLNYRLLSSPDLLQWSVLSNYTIGPSGYWELHLPVGSSGKEFYRMATP